MPGHFRFVFPQLESYDATRGAIPKRLINLMQAIAVK